MRTLLPFIRLFKFAKFPLILGLVLMILGLGSSMGLLTVSGWFLAATAIAGLGTLFNFFYPSASVRGLAIGRTVMRYFEKIVTHDATFRILSKLRVQVFEKIIPLSPAVLNRYRNSDLLNRLVSDVDTLDSLYLRLLAPFFTAAFVIIAMTIGLSFINIPLALGLGLFSLILLIIIPTIFYRLGQQFGERLIQARATYRTQFLEFIQAQAELLLFNAEDKLKEKMSVTEKTWQEDQAKEAKLSGFSTALVLFLNGLLISGMLWFASNADFGTDEYHTAYIALFTFAALAAFEIIMPLGAAFLHIGQVIAAAERVTEIIEQKPLVEFNGDEEFETKVRLISAKNLNFSYPEQETLVLKNLTLDLEQGQKIAILGKTGSGKSSLLQLLVRNYDANQGELLLAEKPISAYSEETLRHQICFLTQRVHVFSDTLRQNLQFASADEISDEKMIEMLHQVGLSKLLEQEGKGLDLWLGDGGRPLSGGEQRRLGLARILLNNAPILLLDEPTEGLDRETERQILRLILQHAENKTLIMVTHRLSSIEQFDKICVIDNGRLIEEGDYESLITKENGFFKRLVERV
ncbi:cysteine/glutathione ABC transporter ATP-binding protein/permease CydC [Haemophilus influenzae]|uniref:Glutathione/L-cysteine transport system ATP-binding/permease protein CydC n=1 Tax=Haemophilus influenzae TaxID=727 RepID=A0A2S9S2R9_HAEIF|nr:cysteine/glutathione ABC transporter ATP-binding protein/permease CydC [Haemophilus influenzae]EEW78880.1 ABC transporter, CydDC cysteine exporter (CydDC-E) family, permease/ATP-binding protein CydC [Haemophilus influenzae NT127]MCK8793847.1 cysteine/glutathione ABC transporter ATP-binding protein/permease CydC [Haemophilus influenzae]MCK8828779.1 cysteine/glutathione ABC transporter ATP-binding protein/permease CydC [Haemophilus influenzae]MCK8840439.1 cysteine/glutathione ABC transporter A